MAKIGIKSLTYAVYSTGGAGGAITYTGGTMLDDYMIRADLSEEREDVKFYADDHQIDSENAMTGLSLSLELAGMTDNLDQKLLGHVSGTSPELNVTDAEAPFVGVGFIRKERHKGTVTYHAYWIYKIRFSKDSDSTQTKGESTDFQTETLTGNAVSVVLTSGGSNIYYSHARQSSEASAVSWVKGKAGIS